MGKQGKIIGISGFKGSGKNVVADMLSDICNCRQIGFAEPLKDAALAMFKDLGIVHAHCYGPSNLRERPIGDLTRIDGEPLTLRYALQTLGTEWGRETCHPDIWATLGMGRAKRFLAMNYDLVVVTDMRFVNEAEVIRANGGKVWFVNRPSARPEDENLHPSEAEMLSYEFRQKIDRTIDNSGDLFHLRREVEAAYDLL